MCDCMNMAGYGPESWGKHHHINCPKYETEKFPYSFYYEEGENCFIPSPEKVEDLFDIDAFDKGEKFSINFIKTELTDSELAALPEE